MIEPTPYRKIESKKIGVYFIRMSPDGWSDGYVKFWRRESGDSNRVHEMDKLIRSVLRSFDTLDSIRKFFRKNGTETGRDPSTGVSTLALCVEKPLLIYTIMVTGPDVEFTGYLRE